MPQAMTWLGAMVIYLLLVFPPVLAFDGYAYFHRPADFGRVAPLRYGLTGAIAAVFKLPAQIISALLVLTLNAGSTYVNYVAQARTWLEIGANVLSILVALRALLARRQEHKRSHSPLTPRGTTDNRSQACGDGVREPRSQRDSDPDSSDDFQDGSDEAARRQLQPDARHRHRRSSGRAV